MMAPLEEKHPADCLVSGTHGLGMLTGECKKDYACPGEGGGIPYSFLDRRREKVGGMLCL